MNAWRLSWNGLRTVTELELKQRIRSRRWIWALVVWFAFIGAISSLMMLATNQLFSVSQRPDDTAGPVTFAIITFFILGMGLLIAPTFTATSINGDRVSGTLATLQATRISALELATGKLLAAWLTSAVFLVVALPFLAWSMILGNISLLQVVVCFAVVFAEVAVVCAIGLGWSALFSRQAGSAVLTYLSVVGLSIILPGVMALLVPLVQQDETIRVWGLSEADQAAYQGQIDSYWNEHPDGDGSGAPAPPIGKCAWQEVTEPVVHTDRIWWLAVPNPFVIVSDAAPLPPKTADEPSARATSPLGAISYGVRWISQPPRTERDECIQLYANSNAYQFSYDSAGNPTVTTASGTPVNVQSPVKRQTVDTSMPIWPWGLAVNILLGALFFWVAVRRLSVPYGVLPKGTRVA